MNNELFNRKEGLSLDSYMLRVGSLKLSSSTKMTWDEYANLINEQFPNIKNKTLSVWRKRYGKLKKALLPELSHFLSDEVEDITRKSYLELLKKRQCLRDERNSFTRAIRKEARNEDIFEILKDGIRKAEPVEHTINEYEITDRAIYCMLSDIHYGICFNTPFNEYNPLIAKNRVLTYADRIINTAKTNSITNECYVSLMGDMISGSIHNTIRILNREDAVSQTMHVSELVVAFLLKLSSVFNTVIVNSVCGNHSRIDSSQEDVLRNEKLDNIVFWYAKNCLSNIDNIIFYENEYDSTIAVTTIFNKTYVAVHGDFDPNPRQAVLRISDLICLNVDVYLSGHMHVSTSRMLNIMYIQNGCVCGSGDDYTSKNRLVSPASQTFMICSEQGVEAIYPVNLQEG